MNPGMVPVVLLPFLDLGWKITAYPGGLDVYAAERREAGGALRYIVDADPGGLALKLAAAGEDVTP
jgi:hypothetical protein